MQNYMEILVAVFALIAAISVFLVVRVSRHEDVHEEPEETKSSDNLNTLYDGEIISVRKTSGLEPRHEKSAATFQNSQPILTINIMAKHDKLFVGYELLQALLSQGLRFGEMDIFHRYQETSGKGPILFSLASAMEPGTFDMPNMGGHRAKGLTLFMQLSGNQSIDNERFDLMYQTAINLAEELEGRLFDNERRLFNENTLIHYHAIMAASSEGEHVA